jgi:hypothetical protein
VCGVEVDVVEPGVAVCVGAAPLCFSHVDVWGDEDAFCGGEGGDVGPDFETGRLGCPVGVFGDDFVGDFGAGGWC